MKIYPMTKFRSENFFLFFFLFVFFIPFSQAEVETVESLEWGNCWVQNNLKNKDELKVASFPGENAVTFTKNDFLQLHQQVQQSFWQSSWGQQLNPQLSQFDLYLFCHQRGWQIVAHYYQSYPQICATVEFASTVNVKMKRNNWKLISINPNHDQHRGFCEGQRSKSLLVSFKTTADTNHIKMIHSCMQSLSHNHFEYVEKVEALSGKVLSITLKDTYAFQEKQIRDYFLQDDFCRELVPAKIIRIEYDHLQRPTGSTMKLMDDFVFH